jgi:hypothetical protein
MILRSRASARDGLAAGSGVRRVFLFTLVVRGLRLPALELE